MKCSAQGKRCEQRCKEDNGNHDCHLRLSKHAGCSPHRGYDQADLAARDHAAADAKASNQPHAARQGSHAASQQFADDGDQEDSPKQQPMSTKRAEITRQPDRNKEQRNQKAVSNGIKGPLNVGLVFGPCEDISKQVGSGDSCNASQPFRCDGVNQNQGQNAAGIRTHWRKAFAIAG